MPSDTSSSQEINGAYTKLVYQPDGNVDGSTHCHVEVQSQPTSLFFLADSVDEIV